MGDIPGSGDIKYGGPAVYRIVVQGRLDEAWSDRLAGMSILTTQGQGQMERTTLQGRVLDQPQLQGVLETLYGLHLSILVVEKIDGETVEQTKSE